MTIHTATDWKTDGKYGLYRRIAADDKGNSAGFEVLLEADKAASCKGCEENAKSGFGPPHVASTYCESGRKSHCTCDACF